MNPVTANERCVACRRVIRIGEIAPSLRVDNSAFYLCADCAVKTARGGRTAQQTIESVLYSLDPEFGGPECVCDHEDYRDLELLGLWPNEDD